MLCHLGLPTLGPQLEEKCVCLMGDGQGSVADGRLCLLGQVLQGAYADLHDDFVVPLIFPSFSSVSPLSRTSCILRPLPLLRDFCNIRPLTVRSSPIAPALPMPCWSSGMLSTLHSTPSPHPMAGVSRFIVLALVGRAPRLLVTLETSADLGGREEGGGRENHGLV